MGTEGTKFFGGKIARYLELYRSASWRGQLPRWPLVLTVVPTLARAAALRRATETLLAAQPDARRIATATTFAFGAIDDLRGSVGPLGAMWHVAGRSGPQLLIPDHDPMPDDAR